MRFTLASCLSLLSLSWSGCVQRSYHSQAAPQDQVAATSAPLTLLAKNTREAREELARVLESDFRQILSDRQPEHIHLRAMVSATIRQLRLGEQACPEQDRITLFRGSNMLLLQTAGSPPLQFGGEMRRWFTLSNAWQHQFKFQPVRASKGPGGWAYTTPPQEKQFLENAEFSQVLFNPLRSLLGFAGGTDINTGRVALNDPFVYQDISSKHTVGSRGSVLVSLTTDFDVASGFGLPTIEGRFCPGRFMPTFSAAYAAEGELLSLAFILPEEIVGLHGAELLPAVRESYALSREPDPQRRQQGTPVVNGIEMELSARREQLKLQFPIDGEGTLSRFYESCAQGVFFERGDKSIGTGAIADVYKTLADKVVERHWAYVANAPQTQPFRQIVSTYLEEACRCENIVHAANEKAKAMAPGNGSRLMFGDPVTTCQEGRTGGRH